MSKQRSSRRKPVTGQSLPAQQAAPGKTTPTRRAAAPKTTPVANLPRWRQRLILLTLLPMLAGILLFVGAWSNVLVLGSATGQTVAGALLALLGFAASNALQGAWLPAGGWTGLGLAVGVLVGLSAQPWAVPVGIVLGVGGIVLIGLEFSRRLSAQTARRR